MAIYQKRRGVRLAVPLDEAKLRKLLKKEGCFCQPKLDGERCRALIMNETGETILLSSEEKVIPFLPHINRAVQMLWCSLDTATKELVREFDGELYSHGLSFEEIHSRVSRKKNPHPKADEIQYHIFDLVCSGDEQFRQWALQHISHQFPVALVPVPTAFVDTEEAAYQMYDGFCQQGYEGVIYRARRGLYYRGRSQTMLKFKPKKSDTYTCRAVEEAISESGEPLGRAGALICQAGEEEFRVGLGLGVTHEVAMGLLRDRWAIEGYPVKISYQNLTDRGIPRFGKFIEIVR